MSSWKENQPQDKWASVKDFRDPVSGKKLPQNPQGDARPVGAPERKPGDSSR